MFDFFNKNKKPKVNFAYGDYVKITDDFYKGFIGRIVAKGEYKDKYLVRLEGKDPVYTNLDLNRNDSIWVHKKHLEKLDVEVEKVKEDFWNKIKPTPTTEYLDKHKYTLESIFGPPQPASQKTKHLRANAMSKITNKKVKYDSLRDEFVVEEDND